MKSGLRPSRSAQGGLLLTLVVWIVAVIGVRSATAGAWAAVHRPAPDADDVVALLAGGAGLLVLGWLAVAAVLTAIAELSPQGTRAARGSRYLADRYAPAALRRGVAVLLGAALLSGVSPAHASPPPRPIAASAMAAALDPGWAPTSTQPSSRSLDPSWHPAGRGPSAEDTWPAADTNGPAASSDRRQPELDPQWGPPSRRRPGALPETAMTVRPGDTLWDIAARHLGPAATDQEIAHTWPRWFAANRAVIGPDPDRLRPGQRLTPPA
jgi:nucleoid-associated protein YgaU